MGQAPEEGSTYERKSPARLQDRAGPQVAGRE